MCGHSPGQPMDWTGVDGPRYGEFASFHSAIASASSVPTATAAATELSRFALSFDGYAAFGKDAAEIGSEVRRRFAASGRLPVNLVVLRCCLFFEQRAAHHTGAPLGGEYVDALLSEIRARLSRTRRVPVMDGARVLAQLVERAGEGDVVQLLAKHTLFLHPDTVAQTQGQHLFPVVRNVSAMRGQRATLGGVDVMYCDNATPTHAFLWASGRGRGTDVQYNHLWPSKGNPRTYTALWNLCVTPAFLAKLTDGARHGEAVAALRYRAYELYRSVLPKEMTPERPPGYQRLTWREPLEAISHLEPELRQRLAENPRSRAAHAARTIGWLFSGWRPDTSLGDAAGKGQAE